MKATSFVLHKAIEGLYALDEGEVPPIFKKAPTTAHGAYPAMLRRCRRQAVTDVAVLKERCGWSIEDAVFEVVEAYDITDNSVRGWRKEFKPLGEPSPNMLQFPVSEAEILKAIKVAGEKFKKLVKLTKHKKRKRIKKHKTVQKLKK